MIFRLRKAILLLFLLVCLTEGSKLMQKLDGVCAQNKILNFTNDITKCGPHGECVLEQMTGNLTESICKCDHHYITVKSVCDYKQRSQLAAFLLSLFLGKFGADWFYLARQDGGYIAIGIVKLLVTLIGGTGYTVTRRTTTGRGKKTVEVTRYGCGVFGCAACIWWIVDWARILAMEFPDGNGQSLAPF